MNISKKETKGYFEVTKQEKAFQYINRVLWNIDQIFADDKNRYELVYIASWEDCNWFWSRWVGKTHMKKEEEWCASNT
jgi:hypothetical protein